jgi:threonine/homoserine/homoserine lactone efflux protein
MTLSLYLGFVLATSLLILLPGPVVSLVVANAVAHGTRYGLLTVAGTSAAILVQLVVTVAGMTAVLGVLATWFEWLRWVGVVYLIYLGVRQWRAPVLDLTHTAPQPRSPRVIVGRGFLVGLTNPKTLLFYSAFFPQFIAPDAPVRPQVTLLAVTFLAIALCLDTLWAVAAGRARVLLRMHGRLRNRLAGGLLVGAGLGLAAAHRS